ncbi:uncharacterized protein LOC128239913 [Mya arenaria]|uniref:uncharacterized protein LOC128239913 n=1 Tax=Mya arenaria TaxID=6604 RepID=UPI0022E33791|nr:uncharacterized protein LOC128239913 [Mya arenaria]
MATAQDQCEMCFEETPVGYCKTCGHIGEACMGFHKRRKAFQNHTVNMYEEDIEKVKKIMRDFTEDCCKEHPTEKSSFLCKVHDCVICVQCIQSGHLSCGEQVVDLLKEAGTMHCDIINHMHETLTELRDACMCLKEESKRKQETSQLQAEACYSDLDSLETRLKRSIEDITRNERKEICTFQDENIEAFSCIASVCERNLVLADEEEEQNTKFVNSSSTGQLYLRSKAFNKTVSEAKLQMKELEHKKTFKMFCLKDNNEALNSLFDILKDVCSIEEEVDGSDDGSTVTHVGGIAASDKHKKRKIKSGHVEEFRVKYTLMGLAIGKQGANIKQAEQVKGVTYIDINKKTCTFKVYGKTEEVCKRAREMLEYAEETYQVPMDLVARVIGMKGKNIQDIVDKSGILRVKIDGAKKGDESRQDWLHRHATFTFVGTVMNISNAQMLLEYSIDHLREDERLRKETLAIDKRLRSHSRITPSHGNVGGKVSTKNLEPEKTTVGE